MPLKKLDLTKEDGKETKQKASSLRKNSNVGSAQYGQQQSDKTKKSVLSSVTTSTVSSRAKSSSALTSKPVASNKILDRSAVSPPEERSQWSPCSLQRVNSVGSSYSSRHRTPATGKKVSWRETAKEKHSSNLPSSSNSGFKKLSRSQSASLHLNAIVNNHIKRKAAISLPQSPEFNKNSEEPLTSNPAENVSQIANCADVIASGSTAIQCEEASASKVNHQLHLSLNNDNSVTDEVQSSKSVSPVTLRKESNDNQRKQRTIKSDSELYDKVHLKSVLTVLRSKLSPEEKLFALKQSHDYWDRAKSDSGFAEWLEGMINSDSNWTQVLCNNETVQHSKQSSLHSQSLMDSKLDGIDQSVPPKARKVEFAKKEPDNKNIDEFQFDSPLQEQKKELEFNEVIKNPTVLCTPQNDSVHASELMETSDDAFEGSDAVPSGSQDQHEEQDVKLLKDKSLKSDLKMYEFSYKETFKQTEDKALVQTKLKSNCSLNLTFHTTKSKETSEIPVPPVVLVDTVDADEKESKTLPEKGIKRDEKDGNLDDAGHHAKRGKLHMEVPTVSAGGERASPKSPVTVQEWVDAIELTEEEEKVEDAANQENQEPNDTDTAVDQLIQEGEDTLGLGAEAQHPDGDTGDKIKSNTLKEGGTMRCLLHEGSEISGTTNVVDKRLSFLQMRNKQGSFHSDISSLSTSSISSSIETLLESRRTDPEEILLSLGFGGNPEPLDPLARIPKRFLKPSQVKGNSLQEFIKHQEEMLETLDTGFCGYRGLSGFLKERQQPVGIVGKILQKIKDNDREVRRSASSPTSTMTSFSEVAFSVMAFNFFRNSLARNQQQHSILEPANREFLDQQSKKKLGNRPRRVILGRDEFSVSHDGSLVHSGKLDRLPLRRRNTALILDDDDTVSESTCFSSDMVSGLDDDESESKAEVEVFQEESAPTESPITKKTFGLWNVCRNVNIRNLATVEEAKMTASKNVSNSFKNEPEINENEIVAGRSARHLMRQHSICDDRSGDESSNKEAKIEPIVDTAAKNKLSKCVESFELEELPTLSDSPERQESPGASIEVAEEPELARIGSAQSDSSGFLDGEAMDPTSDDNLTSDCKVGDYKINESLQSIRKQRDLLPSCTFSCIETADLPSATSVSILKPEPVRPNFTEGFRLLKQPNVPCEIAQNLLSDKLQQSESLFTNNEHACRNFSTVFSDETSSNISNIDQLENQEADEASSSETDPLSENAVKASIIQLLITDNDENKVIVSELIPIDQCSNIDSSDIDTIKYSSESNSLSEDFGNDSIHSFLSNDVLPSCHSLVNNNSSMNNDNMEVEFDSLQEGNKDVISGEGECTNIKEPLSVHSYLTNVNSQTSCNNIEINESNTDIEEVKANSAISEGPNKDERDYDDDQENIVELVTSSDEQKSQLDIKNIDECNDFANITSNEELTNLIVKLSTNNEVQHSFETSIVSKESVPILNQNEKALNKLLDKVTVCAKEDSEIGIKNEGESSCIKSDSVISVVDDSVSISTEPLNKDQLNVSSESLPVSKDLSRKPNEASDSVAKKSSKIASNSHSKQGKPEISNTNYLLPDKVPLRKKGRRHERPHSQEIGKTSYSSYVNVRRLSMEHIPSNFTGLNVVRMLTEDVRSEKKKTDQDGNLQRSRKHSLVTKIVSSELVLSPRSSPIPYSDEIEKYENLKDLLHLVSSDPNETQLSFEEFQAMPSEQKVKVEAYALKQALEKYHQTLYNEEYKDRNQSLTVSLTEDQRHEIEILHKLRQAVRQEVVQAQALLTSRIKVLEKSKEGSTCSQLSYSVNLIRQMVFLLQQQTSLCLRLEQMHIQDKSSSESLAIPGTRDVSYSDRSRPRDYESSTVTMKMQHTLQKFEDNLLEEVRKTVREELNESHKEITELKSMLKNISCLLSNNSSSLHKENQDENILMSCQVPAIHSTEENTHKKQTSSTKQKVAERSMSLPFISQFEFKPIRAPPDEKSFLAHKTVGTDIASNQDEKPNTSKLDLVRVKNKEENLENNNGESDSKTKLHKRKLSPRGPIPPFHTSTFFFPE